MLTDRAQPPTRIDSAHPETDDLFSDLIDKYASVLLLADDRPDECQRRWGGICLLQ
jgi:hypothetical protein